MWGARACCLGLLLACLSGPVGTSREEEAVSAWASELGNELWQLGTHVSKFESIASSYSTMNARVLPTDGEAILSSIVKNLREMFKQKMDSVMCVIEAAERSADEAELNVTRPVHYNSAKCSDFVDADTGQLTPSELTACKDMKEACGSDKEERPCDLYNNVTVSPDMHFHSIPVNTDTSAVHMPTDIYDYAMPVQSALNWSEQLDEVFRQNYESDPSLKWQYFGSSTGFLRMYPAVQWKNENDVYDCRKAQWFIEASTCSKDVVILFDRSGSMKGMSDSIAKLTLNQILSTFSNNDFINILGFNTVLTEIVPCFEKDMLVQATEENIRTFNKYLNESAPGGKANFSTAFIAAFNLLQQYREKKACNEDRSCNQVIMLVTDSVSGNLTEVFEEYNWFENRTHIPVRVFTYLIGREVTYVREIQWMACLNRGYYVHILSHAQVREEVLKYIPVIARPLVLQSVEHPLSWTHAFVDFKDPKVEAWLVESMQFPEQQDRLSKHLAKQEKQYSQSKEDNLYILKYITGPEDGGIEMTYCEGMEKIYRVEEFNLPPERQEYHIMTSVSGPAYDHKVNRGNETREAQLLGVVGTDVPVKDIEKLTLPYKIGANGYAFIITNNGYLIMHPDFRPVFEGKLRANYASVDLTEVELLDDDNTKPREPHDRIRELREAMVNHTGKEVSHIKHLKMKFHYDDMKRVGAESRNYFFSVIPNTPFTVGLALPERYGNYWIKAGNTIKRAKLEVLFQVCPSPAISLETGKFILIGINGMKNIIKQKLTLFIKRVYCDHYIERKKMSHEEKLVYFLRKIQNEKLEEANGWKTKVRYQTSSANQDQTENVTYGCRNTKVSEDDYFCEIELMQLLVFDAKSTEASYKDSVWTPDNNIERDLVKKYNVSVRFVATQSGLTRWQHIDELAKGEFEFGELNNKAVGEAWYRAAVLQYYIDDRAFVFSVPFDSGKVANLSVTASHAIFRRDGGNEAPGSVAGFLFSHSALFQRFRNVTSKTSCNGCIEPCSDDTTDCYVIDGNGYIIVSENREDTGTFFGEKEGAIMENMIKKKIFRKIPMFDYQAVCFKRQIIQNAANFLKTPFQVVGWFLKWTVTQLAWLLLEADWNRAYTSAFDWFSGDDDDYVEAFKNNSNTITTPLPTIDDRTVIMTKACSSCDKSGNLYLLQSDKQSKTTDEKECHRPYFMKRIPHTNLLLIVVKTDIQACQHYETTDFTKEEYHKEFDHPIPSCVKSYLNNYPRRRLSGCFNEHPQELEIERCGRGTLLVAGSLTWLPTLVLLKRYILF